MNALIVNQVARLTRPQRIRCRPCLQSRLPSALTPIASTGHHGSTSTARTYASGPSSSWRAPSTAATPTSSKKASWRGGAGGDRDMQFGGEGEGEGEGEGGVHLRKGDKLDWEVAVEMAEERKRRGVAGASSGTRMKRNPELPSLSSGRRGAVTGAAAAGQEAAKAVMAEVAAPAEAGPSTAPIRAARSRKGKEKAEPEQADSPVEMVMDQAPAPISELHEVGPSEIRRNPVGVQLLSPSLHRQLFPSSSHSPPPQSIIDISRSHLATHGLSPEGAAVLPEISFDMPPLQGADLREHFHNLGTSTAEPYRSMARQLAEVDLPEMPDIWELRQAGWTKYHSDGRMEAVKDLGEEMMVSFDVETLYKLSPYPVMAVAASPSHWYSWLSPALFGAPPVEAEAEEERPAWDRTVPPHHPNDLIPLFPQPYQTFTGPSGGSSTLGTADDRARLVIGHNVGYDRARVSDEYSLERTSTRWLDTLSLHVATHGITSVQRPVWQAYRKNKRQKREREAEALAVMRDAAEEEGDADLLAQLDAYALDLGFDSEGAEAGGSDVSGSAAQAEASQKRWEDITSVNSLAEVAALHCGYKVDKSIRNRFADDSITHASQLLPELETLLAYCAKDVKVTHDVYRKVFPLFETSCPHPASFSGVLSMGNSFLPVDENWGKYLQAAERKYREMDEGVRKALRVLAEKTRKEGRKEGDVWSEQLDWSEKRARWGEEVGEAAMKELLGGEYAGTGTGATVEEAEVDSSSDVPVIQKDQDGTSEGAARDQPTPDVQTPDLAIATDTVSAMTTRPAWQAKFDDPAHLSSLAFARYTLPLLLRLSYKTHPVVWLCEHGWCFRVPEHSIGDYVKVHGDPVHFGRRDRLVSSSGLEEDSAFFRLDKDTKKSKLTGPSAARWIRDGVLTAASVRGQAVLGRLRTRAAQVDREDVKVLLKELEGAKGSVWGKQLDWTAASGSFYTGARAVTYVTAPAESPSVAIITPSSVATPPASATSAKCASSLSPGDTWPKWYWDLTAPTSRLPAGQLDLTTKKSVAPLLLRLQWKGFPLCYSREHKWLFRVPSSDSSIATLGDPVMFAPAPVEEVSKSRTAGSDPDAVFRSDTEHAYFRLPHKDGDGHNVGNPLSKSFVKAIESGDLASAAAADGQADEVARKAAADATNMNVLCSYWISSRERIMGQMVVYDQQQKGKTVGSEGEQKRIGMILPQVITMGTVTRRAVEATWLTASNAKKNRVGSELKAMVRAPPGYALVGADVDSEELWISSIMGDSQFGMHGASAIGWMTLEGTKSAGTDLHSKTASILGISRDAAKVFNYSRIYGAGQKHAVQLLLQGDPSLSKEDATKRAEELYKQTKGSKATRNRSLPAAKTPSVWHGGSESYLFNTLEAIAHAERPTTPALGCGVTHALTKGYLESESSFLPSRINWVVQSSGVDYLHLLIVSMEYLIKTYGIQARYLISVHDEVRYLAKEEDQYRTALALQIANAWTRALFCYNLGMDDMPQGVAFFSAVDVDKVLRKEVFMSCETPSHPVKIPEGQSLGIEEVLRITSGSLGPVVSAPKSSIVPHAQSTSEALQATQRQVVIPQQATLYKDITSPTHRLFLEAQANNGGALARNWLDRQVPVESEAKAMVRSVRRNVRNFAPAKARGTGAKADEVRERMKGRAMESMKSAKEEMREASRLGVE